MATTNKFNWPVMNLNTWRTTYQTFLGLVAFITTVVVVSDTGEIRVEWALAGTAFATLVTYLDNIRRQTKEAKINEAKKAKASAAKKATAKKAVKKK